MNSERLKDFRQAAYDLLVLAKDATFELMDAVMTTRNASCLWVLAIADLRADCLMRVRSNACLWSAPPAYSGRGRPRKHGQKMRVNDPTTWLQANTIDELATLVG